MKRVSKDSSIMVTTLPDFRGIRFTDCSAKTTVREGEGRCAGFRRQEYGAEEQAYSQGRASEGISAHLLYTHCEKMDFKRNFAHLHTVK